MYCWCWQCYIPNNCTQCTVAADIVTFYWTHCDPCRQNVSVYFIPTLINYSLKFFMKYQFKYQRIRTVTHRAKYKTWTHPTWNILYNYSGQSVQCLCVLNCIRSSFLTANYFFSRPFFQNVLLKIRARSFKKSAYRVSLAANTSLFTPNNSLSHCTLNKPGLLSG